MSDSSDSDFDGISASLRQATATGAAAALGATASDMLSRFTESSDDNSSDDSAFEAIKATAAAVPANPPVRSKRKSLAEWKSPYSTAGQVDEHGDQVVRGFGDKSRNANHKTSPNRS